MAEANLSVPGNVPVEEVKKARQSSSSVVRVAKYMVVRILMLAVTVAIGVYLTVLIANMGGYVDEIRRGDIRETISQRVLTDPTLKALDVATRTRRVEEMIALEEHRVGLDRPFAVRSFGFLKNALMLNLGRASYMSSDAGSRMVKNIILERLPATLLLTGSASLINFFITVAVGLSLSRKYGSKLDKFIIGMSPTSAIPAWFYSLFLILVFAAWLGWLPYGGMVSAPPPEEPILYALSLLQHMILPVTAWMVAGFFGAVYGYRTYFLIYSSEDYVDMAKAKGLSDKNIERRYVLRPTLPNIITTFAFLLIGAWSGAPIFETVFNWPGIGRLTLTAVNLYETSVIVGTTVVFSFLLAITVFILDFVYAVVDPRIKIGGEGRNP
jgi:peptide/nickel transport system permease protein